MGGWVGSPTFDFAPSGGEDQSPDFLVQYNADSDFYLDIVGDDDTIVWRTAGIADISVSDPYARVRGGYCGMINRQSPNITYPFIFMAGACADAGAGSTYNALAGKDTGSASYNFQRYTTYNTMRWPSYSLWKDGSAVVAHRMEPYYRDSINRMRLYHYTNEDLLPAIRLGQWESPDHFAIIGEFRMYVAVGSDKGEGQLHGNNNEWLQFCYQSTTHGGVSMRWPQGVTPLW